ncbi:hypothetical protein GMOD_00004767 [Pyrenophora seminiperda CCB06]|uniref:Uncharacterized protein n=1 Tax=Pyrenophora seminiperda CCB06 TaxID=1302712 RepID=A0A3M7MHZ4_9PLEO|nr:hypothetical protein GMOD_00004767 [Pyrenophora seminiperda CCB06]
MALLRTSLLNMATRPVDHHQRVASHGRGGAGNIAKDDPANYTKPEDLVTPTLKSDTYTTGRGGTGNMARNDPQHPELARAAQDVDSKPQPEAQGPKHYGRGGAANVIGEQAKRNSDEAKREEQGAGKGLLGKGKDLLNKLGKK